MSSIYSSGRRSDSEEYEGSGASDSDSDYEQDDGDDNGDDRPSRAGPARPTRSEYAAYAAMVRDLTAAKEGNLARQLLQAGHHTSHDEFHDSEPAQAAINQSSSNGIITTQSLTTAWPLRISELPKLSVTLNEVILAFASSYIRKEGLVHSASAIGQSVNQDVTSGSPSKRGQALSDQLESTLPDLVISTRSLLEENLARLGTMRPAEVRKKRAKLGRMGWRDVMAAAGLDSRRRAEVERANERLRDMYKYDGEDLLAHRLRIIAEANAHRKTHLSEELYPEVRRRKDGPLRPHQSPKEQAERERKRQLKLERRAAKHRNKT